MIPAASRALRTRFEFCLQSVSVTFVSVALAALAASGCSSQALDSDAGDAPPPGTPAPGSSSLAEPDSSFGSSAYPPGPYGRDVGATIQDMSFLGWRNGPAVGYDPEQLEVVRLSDFYNPEGSKDVRLLAINASAVWCTVCRAEYRQLDRDAVYAEFRPKGVEILGVLFEDADYEPAKPADLRIWGGPDGFNVPFPLVIDPGFKIGQYFATDATPMNMLIDTRTMEIIDILMGYDTSRPEAYWSAIDEWLAR